MRRIRTRAQIALVIFAILCFKFDCGVCDDVTTEEPTTLSTDFTDTTLFEDTTANSEYTSEFTVQDAQSTPQSACSDVPGEVQYVEATADNHVISLTWEPPEDASCVKGYVVSLGEDVQETTDTMHEFKDLEACTSHQGEVAAISDGDTTGPATTFTAKTTKPTTLREKVVGLTLKSSLVDVEATWGPPDKKGACIHEYKIQVWDQSGITKDYSTNKLHYTITPIVPCMQYNFQITPTLSEVIYGLADLRSELAAPQAISAPTTDDITWSKTNIDVIVKLLEYSANMCAIQSIDIYCVYFGSDPLWWMIQDRNVSMTYSNDGNLRPPVSILVDEVSPYTDYKCDIMVVNSGGTSNPYEFIGKTLEDAPSEPENFKCLEEEEIGINFSWDDPTKIPGILGNYKINITYEKSNHMIPQSCDVVDHDVEGHEQGGNIYYFKNPIANSQYLATVEASTGAGFGKEAQIQCTTKPRESEPVRNLDYNITNNPGDIYDVTAHIKWLTPCNTNGNLLKFTYDILEESLDDPDINFTKTGDVQVNEDHEIESYVFDIPDIKPLYSYTVTVSAVISGSDMEIVGTSDTITFSSPDGFPSAPTNIRVVDLTSTSAKIEWGEPANKNGEILSYAITIQTIGPLHIVPDAECNVDNSEHNEVVSEDVFSYQYNNFLSNFEYKVTMKAETNAGYGSEDTHTFSTQESPSEIVRNVNTAHTTVNTEEYNATVVVTFMPPCHLNGAFTYFEFSLSGTRDGFSEHKEEKKLEKYDENTVKILLKPEYYYEGFIEVHTANFVSEKALLTSFTSSSGVPENDVMDLLEPDVIDPFTAKFQLKQATFTNTVGEIRYFAIILAPASFEPEEDYGIWNTDWPDTGHWSKDGDLKEYQTTPKEWNPFLSLDSKESYVFTIGENSCDNSSDDYCNGPLRPDMEYSLRVRGFTSSGYRDTPRITFWTPSDTNYGALIGGIVGGALALLIIFIIIIVFWRRRKNRKEVDDTAMDTLSLVPAPVPIKNFAAYHNECKANLSKLKAEFSLLERKSAAEQLSTTFALTDDNKKKNRYLNVLPYDETRVKLDRDKNDNYTDYINASFIKGYSGHIEYIATQGPLESTVVDFWRMVIQENVSVIAMVAQFVELDKPKCHQYFPNNHETMKIGDGIEIRCANELPLGGYIKRTLMVQRELMQMTITHLQYIQWPDFGCPNDTESMLDFCNVFRQCIEQCKSKTIVHCSAGVGRTGTLIALDMLFQTIENKGDIDIFKTILNLRKQRIRMVQAEKQYVFLHSCIAEYISNPKRGELKEIEPIYENVTIKKDKEDSAKDIP